MGNGLTRDALDGGLTKKELERMHRRSGFRFKLADHCDNSKNGLRVKHISTQAFIAPTLQ